MRPFGQTLKKIISGGFIRLLARIAKDTGKHLHDVAALPSSEIALWQAVYAEEYYEAFPDKRPKERMDADEQVKMLKNWFNRRKK